MMQKLIEMAERGWFPDAAIRVGIRRLCAERLREIAKDEARGGDAATRDIVRRIRESPLAESTRDANEQHYEVPTELFLRMLGPRLKYSCCLWSRGAGDLATAEEQMLALTCERAGIRDGQTVLELGCGWGSLTLWMAERHPSSRITAVSNSATQREYIESECRRRALSNVRVLTSDMNDFDPRARFDRIVSVEMFEHMRNYEMLLRRIAAWLEPGGAVFVHLFCHAKSAYFYEPSGPGDWMAREFFTGGTMPSENLLRCFPDALAVEEQWRVGGGDYRDTLEAWLRRLDEQRDEALAALAAAYGNDEAPRQLQRWRIFLMACSELFGFDRGRQWFVAHYRLRHSAELAGVQHEGDSRVAVAG